MQYYTYMHIVEPADENKTREPEWEGITGRVKQLLEMQSKELKEDVAMVAQRQDEMAQRHEELAMALERIEDLLLSTRAASAQ